MPRTVTIRTPAMPSLKGGDALEFKSLSGGEQLFGLYCYTIDLQTPDLPDATEHMLANVPIKDLVGKEFTVEIELDGREQYFPSIAGGYAITVGQGTREISGIVTQARYVNCEDRRGLYQVVIEPWLTLATRTADHKIFQNQTPLEIIQAVLSDYAYPTVDRTVEIYPKRIYQVQYGETDYDFITRLMAEWGMYYYFEHADGTHRLVLCDGGSSHKPFTSEAYHVLRYYPPGHKVNEEYVSVFDTNETLRTGAWVTSDFDFENPRANLEEESKMPRKTGHSKLEIYQWPGDYTEPDEGRTIARLRMEQAGSEGSRASGSGQLRGVVCGCTFKLELHPHERANQEYLVLSNSLNIQESGASSGQEGFSFATHFVVQPMQKTYRPPIPKDANGHPKKPRTTGPQTAIVTGPKGQEIWTDKYGRVKVSFHWNRYCSKDEASSCWIRVASPWAGSNFGGIHIPRIGQEVVVDFENGDPDCPIIIGRVYNALNMPPWDLPANQTQSGVLTRSTMEGGPAHANALRFEDLKGKEEVWLHAEKDQRIEVEHDESHWVGHDRSKTIDHDETNHIKNDRTETVDGHEKITVHKTRVEEVDGNETLTVHSNRSRRVDGNEQESIGKNKLETIAMAHMQNIGLAKMVNVGAAYNTNVGGLMATVVGAQRNDVTALNHNVNVGKSYILEATDVIEIKVGKSILRMDKDGKVTINGKEFLFEASGPVQISGKDIDLN